jgi:hypothetical protein
MNIVKVNNFIILLQIAENSLFFSQHMKHILATLTFYVNNSGWHTYDKRSKSTTNAIKSLVRLGYLETNEFNQAKWTNKTW